MFTLNPLELNYEQCMPREFASAVSFPIYLSALCTHTADPNPFRGIHCMYIILFHLWGNLVPLSILSNPVSVALSKKNDLVVNVHGNSDSVQPVISRPTPTSYHHIKQNQAGSLISLRKCFSL